MAVTAQAGENTVETLLEVYAVKRCVLCGKKLVISLSVLMRLPWIALPFTLTWEGKIDSVRGLKNMLSRQKYSMHSKVKP